MLAGCWTLDVGLQYPAAPPSAYKLYPGAENFGLVAVWCAKALNLKPYGFYGLKVTLYFRDDFGCPISI